MRAVVLALLAVFLIGERAAYANSQWVLLNVGQVRITATRPGSTQPWATPAEKPKVSKCDLIGLVPGAGAVKLLCNAAGVGQQGRSTHANTAPDLFLRVRASPDVTYRSYTVDRAFAHEFNYQVVVPLDAVPPAGIELAVVSDDGSGTEDTQETVGSFRLTKDQLLQAATAGSLISLKDGGVEKVEATATFVADEAPKHAKESIQVDQQLVQIGGLDVPAGEVVEVRADGNYTFSRRGVGPAGDPNGPSLRKLGGALQSAPAGAAVAMLGRQSRLQAVAVGRCAAFVARNDGHVTVGINDRQAASDTGALDFDVSARLPTASEWASGKPAESCSTAAAADPQAAAWADKAVRAVAEILQRNGPAVAATIQRITHPSGKRPALQRPAISRNGGDVTVEIPVSWNGGLVGTPYVTKVRWEFSKAKHTSAIVATDTATIRVAGPNAQQLDAYFRDQLYSAVSKSIP